MRNLIFPVKDTSLYESHLTKNTGIDEILDVGKLENESVRSLIQFDVASIAASIQAGMIPANAQYFMNLFVAHAEELEENQIIEIYPVSQSWTEGSGYFVENIENPANGASWKFRSGVKLNLPWTGSSWYFNTDFPDVEKTHSFSIPIDDLRVNITNIVTYWLSGSIPNNGIVLKIPNVQEESTTNITKISFFSNQTHTIYKPTLEIAWDDQSYFTASLSKINSVDSIIGTKNLLEKYSVNNIARVDVSVRDKYPLKTFANIFSRYTGTKYLPSTSYYSILDAQTNKTIIPFDEFSKISCDSSGSFFMLNTSGLFPTRQYKIFVKVINAATSLVYDTNSTFSIR